MATETPKLPETSLSYRSMTMALVGTPVAHRPLMQGKELDGLHDIIAKLHTNNGMTQKQIQRRLEGDYHRQVRPQMLRDRIKKWGLDDRYNRGHVVQAIIRKKREREADGEESVFFHQGKRVNLSKIEASFKRRQPSLAQCTELQRPKTPPDLIYFSPIVMNMRISSPDEMGHLENVIFRTKAIFDELSMLPRGRARPDSRPRRLSKSIADHCHVAVSVDIKDVSEIKHHLHKIKINYGRLKGSLTLLDIQYLFKLINYFHWVGRGTWLSTEIEGIFEGPTGPEVTLSERFSSLFSDLMHLKQFEFSYVVAKVWMESAYQADPETLSHLIWDRPLIELLLKHEDEFTILQHFDYWVEKTRVVMKDSKATTLAFELDRACCLLTFKRMDEAENLLRSIHDTAMTLGLSREVYLANVSLSNIYTLKKDHMTSEWHAWRILEYRHSKYGLEHPRTQSACLKIEKCSVRQGRLEQAEDLRQGRKNAFKALRQGPQSMSYLDVRHQRSANGPFKSSQGSIQADLCRLRSYAS